MNSNNNKETKHKDVIVRLYKSMLESNAWQDLNTSTMVLYICMKAQWSEKPDSKGCFYFNRTLASKKYGIKNPNQIQRNITSLVQHGLIEVAEKKQGKKTIYKLSNKWQEWTDQEK